MEQIYKTPIPAVDHGKSIRTTNLRFNLEKEQQRRAWEHLQGMDKAQFKSYSQAVAMALVDYFDRYYKTQDDPYFETRAREERFVSQIVATMEAAMEKTLPVFLAGCMAGLTVTAPPADIEQDALGG